MKLVDKTQKFGPDPDTYFGFTDEKEIKKIKKAIALNEKWLATTRELTYFTHEFMKEVIAVRKYDKEHLSGSLFDYYVFLADRFGMTKPPLVPSDKDRAKIAAIFDRIVRMNTPFKLFQIHVHKIDSEDTKWSSVEHAATLSIGASLGKETDLKIATVLLQELISEVKNITGGLEAEYLAMIYRARKIAKLEPY
jgi:hypothetical protein